MGGGWVWSVVDLVIYCISYLNICITRLFGCVDLTVVLLEWVGL